jgi:hypothetical protein
MSFFIPPPLRGRLEGVWKKSDETPLNPPLRGEEK